MKVNIQSKNLAFTLFEGRRRKLHTYIFTSQSKEIKYLPNLLIILLDTLFNVLTK